MNNFGFQFDNTYENLPSNFFTYQDIKNFSSPKNFIFNTKLAEELGLNIHEIKKNNYVIFGGGQKPQGASFISQAYSGHQFGHFTNLGDGRAVLAGEHISLSKQRLDIHLKGSGPTLYGRRGDGLAALGPMLREYIISEAMHALGVPTTRSLSVMTTGEPVYRETILEGAMLTRIASSHIRVGTFEFASSLNDPDNLKIFCDYTINRHFPELINTKDSYAQFLKAVVKSQAKLIAQWMSFGFIHGVMNTDNMAISGETIDYGPCSFMNTYHPETVYSSIDKNGRYAFTNQPIIGQWNLTRFAESLLPLLHNDLESAKEIAISILKDYQSDYHGFWYELMLKKIGISDFFDDGDKKIIDDLLMLMQKNQSDFTNTFRNLQDFNLLDSSLIGDTSFTNWYQLWKKRLAAQGKKDEEINQLMMASNPCVIPRNHLVEAAIEAAQNNNKDPLESLIESIQSPFKAPKKLEYLNPPSDEFEKTYRTFCGT
jgi:uncharacterized protein YdiU (UPF0061 family)